jgi:hypothetical protein
MKLTNDSALVKFFNKIVSPQSQILGILVVASIAIILGMIPYKRFISLEPETQVVPVTPECIKEWGNVPTRVTVGLYINGFPSLDFVKNEFIFDGILWFEFDPALISLNTVSKFSLEGGEIIKQSEPYTQVIDNKFFARYIIQGKFKADLDYKLFPFDDHRLDIILANRSIQPSEMIFKAYTSYFVIPPTVKFIGWNIWDLSVRSGMSESVLNKYESQKVVTYPRVVFSIFLRRSGVRNMFLILLPLFLIYFISLFTFAFDPETHPGTIFGIASAGVTSLLSYRFVIENMTPKVGYFVLSDHLFVVFLGAALIEFIFAVVLMRAEKMTPTYSIVRGIIYILINVVFLCVWGYFLLNA